jgi:uncharacterized repeat protein (TIGR01451 family)
MDKPTTIPFTVVNHGNSQEAAPATVTVDVPSGLRVDDLAPAGWDCTAPGGASAPVTGPVTLTCKPVDGSGDPRRLALDEPEQLTLALTPTAASASNVCVTASISGPMFDPVSGNNQDNACQPVALPLAALTLDKSSVFADDANNNGLADLGDVLTYTFHVENTGEVDIEGITIDDPKVTAIVPASADIPEGGSRDFTASYTVTQADIDAGGTRNTATAGGTPTTGGTVTSSPDTDEVPGPEPMANVSVVKSAELTTDAGVTGKADVGDVITYTFTVHNAGPATAHEVSVSDPMTGLSAITPTSVSTLAPGENAEFMATYEVRQSDVDHGSVTNQAAVEYRDPTPPGGPAPDFKTVDSNEVEVDAIAAGPSLTIDKSSVFADDANGDGLADLGDVLTYTFHVENTGNVTLTGVTVTDNKPGVSAITPASAMLAPGESQDFTASYTVRQSDVDAGGTFNTATATGTPPTGAAVVSDPDTDKVEGPRQVASASIAKSAELTTDKGVPGKADAGDVITYTFVVHNDGPTTAHDVSVSDPLTGLTAVVPASVARLAPGDDAAFTATYKVTAADVAVGSVMNQATASFTPPTPSGGPEPAPVTTPPSNVVETPTAARARPKVTTQVPARRVALDVRNAGSVIRAKTTDVATISGWEKGGEPVRGKATLYGPTSALSPKMCTTAREVDTVRFHVHNGTIRVPRVGVDEPGYYTWKVEIPGNELNRSARHACGLARESFLAHRHGYRTPVINTGFVISSDLAGTLARGPAAAPSDLRLGGLGIHAPVQTVGLRGGQMMIPHQVHRVGWLRNSAGIGDLVGTSVIAGHVSDWHDRPGAFWKLPRAHRGDIVKVHDGSGTVHRYKVISKKTYLRSKPLPHSLFSTTGRARLILVSCTRKVRYPDGHFHYTRNLVVTAIPLR